MTVPIPAIIMPVTSMIIKATSFMETFGADLAALIPKATLTFRTIRLAHALLTNTVTTTTFYRFPVFLVLQRSERSQTRNSQNERKAQ